MAQEGHERSRSCAPPGYRRTTTARHRLLDIAVYHCQQAAEKALKAWLTSQDVIFPKTRELEKLLGLCLPAAPDFAKLQPACEELTPFAHEFRYPGDISEPDSEQARRALALAEEIFACVVGEVGGLTG